MANLFSSKRFWGSLLFMGIGAVLLLKNLQMLPAEIPPYVFTWKMLLIIIGFLIIIIKKNFWTGMVMVGIGAYFLIPEALGISIEQLYVYWPVIFILIGLSFLIQPRHKHHKYKWNKYKYKDITTSTENYMVITTILGGNKRIIRSDDFKGGAITAILGGIELDLTQCTLSKEKCILDIELVMGGIELTVPKEWNIITEVTPIMGGIEDHVKNMREATVDKSLELTIRGTVVMGGMEIKRV